MAKEKTINERLRDLRTDNDWTQKELAEQLYISPQTYGRYEKTKTNIPNSIVIRLSDIYGISTDYLLGLTDTPAPQTPIKLPIYIKKDMFLSLDNIAKKNNKSRNELINQFLQYGVEHIK